MVSITSKSTGSEPIPLAEYNTVGRDGHNNIQFTWAMVSRVHCRIWRYDGQWYIRDLGSTNGTRVNGNKLVPHRAYGLNDLDNIVIGGCELLFQDC